MQSFNDLNLPEPLAKTLDRIGFLKPTEIQAKAIPLLMDGQDVLACSETGSGKTGAYLLPMLTYLLENPKEAGLILAPTRELALQISQFLQTLVRSLGPFHTATLLGGQDIRKQFKTLQKKPRVIVATPGRLIDHLNRNTVQLNRVGYLVLDEGDRMIDMGFEPQLKEILKFLPEADERQTLFFTATLDKKVKSLTKKYLTNPASVLISNSKPVSSIRQSAIKVPMKEKDELVLNELNDRDGSVIIFLKTRYKTDRLRKYLAEFGVSVDTIHGGKNQSQRTKTIQAFKKGKTRVLCATDVAARGIDVPQIKHVINYDLPMQDEDYVHRVGRTARNGAEGEAISFVMPNEYGDWNRLVKKYEIPDAMIETSKGRSKPGGDNRPSKHGSSRRSSGGKTRIEFREKKSKSGSKKKGRSNSDASEIALFEKPKRKSFSKSKKRFEDSSDRPKRKSLSGRKRKFEESYDRPEKKSFSKPKKKFEDSSDQPKSKSSSKPKRQAVKPSQSKKKFSAQSGGPSKKKFGSKKKAGAKGPGSKFKSKSRSKSSGRASSGSSRRPR